MTVDEANRILSFGLLVLIWMVQSIVYPAFGEIATDRFAAWHTRYTRAVTWIVVPLMFGQVGTLGWLLVTRPKPLDWLGGVMVAIAWLATFALAVPAHEMLQEQGQDGGVVRRLIAANWIRTVAWTLAFLCSLSK
ncbi:hypothetical protein ACYOEI_19240 [Singulisphaera rosea]